MLPATSRAHMRAAARCDHAALPIIPSKAGRNFAPLCSLGVPALHLRDRSTSLTVASTPSRKECSSEQGLVELPKFC